VGGSEAKKGPGSDLFLDILYPVFELPSPRDAQKLDKANREKIGLFFWPNFLLKLFDTIFL
jgi:hypothetical protein